MLHNEFAVSVLQREPNQLLWQSLHMADIATLLSHQWWKRRDGYENGHREEPVIKHELLTLVVIVVGIIFAVSGDSDRQDFGELSTTLTQASNASMANLAS